LLSYPKGLEARFETPRLYEVFVALRNTLLPKIVAPAVAKAILLGYRRAKKKRRPVRRFGAQGVEIRPARLYRNGIRLIGAAHYCIVGTL
jgi:hypothetical protein